MRIAVLGGGLVGRLAAWAAMQAGHSPTILDRMYDKIAKPPRGFVYLHENCDLPLEPQLVTVMSQGEDLGYKYKVYGDRGDTFTTSFGRYDGTRECFDPGELLSLLNGFQHGMVEERNFADRDEVLALREEYDRLVFTLPVNSFFGGHWPFIKASVGAWPLNAGERPVNTCVYNSNPEIPWNRAGIMFGWAFREFPTVLAGHQPIVKVMPGDPPPEIENVLFTGRFGSWTKQLSHQSYREVLEWLT